MLRKVEKLILSFLGVKPKNKAMRILKIYGCIKRDVPFYVKMITKIGASLVHSAKVISCIFYISHIQTGNVFILH